MYMLRQQAQDNYFIVLARVSRSIRISNPLPHAYRHTHINANRLPFVKEKCIKNPYLHVHVQGIYFRLKFNKMNIFDVKYYRVQLECNTVILAEGVANTRI